MRHRLGAILALAALLLTINLAAAPQAPQNLRGSIEPATALLLAGVILAFSFAGDKFFESFGFPDVILLIVLGILLGPVTGLIDKKLIEPWVPHFAALVLIFILFDSGIKLDMKQVLAGGPRAIALALSGFALSLATTAAFSAVLLFWGKPLVYSLLLGAILGGTSSVIVISLVSRMKVSRACSTTVTLESVITDVLCVVVAIAILRAITGGVGLGDVAKDIATKFIMGAAIGFLAGLLCLFSLYGLRKAPHLDVLLFALVLLVYSLSEWVGGSGALSSLFFGLTLGNEKGIYKGFRLERKNFIDRGFLRFETEVTFILRTFFFLYLGLMFSVRDLKITLLGGCLSLLLYLARALAVRVATARSPLAEERTAVTALFARGLAAAVLATLPMTMADRNPTLGELADTYMGIVASVIFFTSIGSAIGTFILKRSQRKAGLNEGKQKRSVNDQS